MGRVRATSHMRRAGYSPEERAAVYNRAEEAERAGARLLGGRWIPPGLENIEHGDVKLPDGTYVDVKYTSWRGPLAGAVINLGEHRPPTKHVLVLVDGDGPDGFRPVGWADRKHYRHDAPAAYGPGAVECWNVRGADLRPWLWPAGTALGPARLCPSCGELHPAGTTCAGGWAPWRPAPAPLPWEED